jgi:UDP-N-acetylglucosamine acyltransferase
MSIHPTAIVDSDARVSASAEIGPHCIIGADVEIGAGTLMMAHVYVEGVTHIGQDNVFYPYSTIGVASQDLKYKGERAETRIGSRNKIREFVSIHRGTEGGGLVTEIGDDNLLMAYAHVAHDVRIGNHTQLGNAVTFAGHVIVEDWTVIEAFSGVHQFCRIGKHAFVGGYSVVTKDVLPYSMTVSPRESRVFGENKVGLERRGFARESIESLHKAFRLLTKSGLNTTQAVERIRQEVPECAEVRDLLAFMERSERGFVK